MNLLIIYNYLNIFARTIVSYFYMGEKSLPLLYCNFKKILDKNFPEGSLFTFIQVGAFDGVSHDVLYDFVKKRDSEGIVIEPIKEYFNQLAENYSFNKKIVTLNTAVHSSLKEIALYKVSAEYLHKVPDWAAGISSISPTHHQKTNIPAELMTKVNVQASPLMELLNGSYTASTINLFQTDTEGYDYEILKSFDFTRYKPDIIKLEYVNLSKKDITECITILRKQGYYCLYELGDLIGLRLNRIRL